MKVLKNQITEWQNLKLMIMLLAIFSVVYGAASHTEQPLACLTGLHFCS